jgi:uncharacterized protein (DUF433 family)
MENVTAGASSVHVDPEILSGTPVFVGTRVPAASLFDWLSGGATIEEFLDNFPGVSRDQAVALLEEAKVHVTGKARAI